MNKRIRKKQAKLYGFCPKCGGTNTSSVAALYKRGRSWVREIALNSIQCWRCGLNVTAEQLAENKGVV